MTHVARHAFLMALLLPLLALSGCAGIEERDAGNTGDPPQWRDNQLIVALDARAPDAGGEAEVDALVERLGSDYAIAPLKRFPLTSIGVICVVFRVPDGASPAALADRLALERDVRVAQVNQVFESQGGTSDRYAQLQWGANAVGVTALKGRLTGEGARVGIVDTAVDTEHPDLSGAVVSSMSFVADDVDAEGAEAHGTAVAGIVAARSNNGHGIAGLAPAASLLVARACWYREPNAPAARCSSWSLARAVDYLLNESVDVINLSLAGPEDALLQEVLAQATQRGVAVVASGRAGSDGPGFPASAPGVVAVVAADSRGHWPQDAWHASVRPVPAPGVEILTTLPPARYDYLSGSSMAAAHVSAILALLHEAAPDATANQRVGALRAGAALVENGGQQRLACEALGRLGARTACD